MSYKDKIIDSEWNTGSYESKLSDIKETKMTAKVGLPSILDIKFDQNMSNHQLSIIVMSCDKYSEIWNDFFVCRTSFRRKKS